LIVKYLVAILSAFRGRDETRDFRIRIKFVLRWILS